jgi:hypothetical protein
MEQRPQGWPADANTAVAIRPEHPVPTISVPLAITVVSTGHSIGLSFSALPLSVLCGGGSGVSPYTCAGTPWRRVRSYASPRTPVPERPQTAAQRPRSARPKIAELDERGVSSKKMFLLPMRPRSARIMTTNAEFGIESNFPPRDQVRPQVGYTQRNEPATSSSWEQDHLPFDKKTVEQASRARPPSGPPKVARRDSASQELGELTVDQASQARSPKAAQQDRSFDSKFESVSSVSEREVMTIAAAAPKGMAIYIDHFDSVVREKLKRFDKNNDGKLTGDEILEYFESLTGDSAQNSAHNPAADATARPRAGARQPMSTPPESGLAIELETNEDTLVSASRIVECFIEDSGVKAEMFKIIFKYVNDKAMGEAKRSGNRNLDTLDVLRVLQKMQARDFEQILDSHPSGRSFVTRVADELGECAASRNLEERGQTEIYGNGKFAHIGEATYGTVEDFVAGVTAVGYPSVDPLDGMRAEHEDGPDANDTFEAMNTKLNKSVSRLALCLVSLDCAPAVM